jgi:wyosine [tRNA(Phe)-imidazoG37] synthetase (radical SAM superfamily)
MSQRNQYLFGPVPSRRLGRSLGVDLIPVKTCTMDCVYCQLGETTCEVSRRKDYVPIQAVLAELAAWKTADGAADHITLAGSGEPTLHLRFGEVLRWVKDQTAIPSVLLTNGTLLHQSDVRDAAALADKVKVTLSAWDEASFRQIHRPARGITFDRLIKGERALRQIYSGELSVEVFIVDGINSREEQCRKIAEVVRSIEPDRIDINTVVRPPAMQGVSAPPAERLQALAALFGDKAVIAATPVRREKASAEVSEDAVLELIKRHPATCRQLAEEYNVKEDRMERLLQQLVGSGLLMSEDQGGEMFYMHRSS